MALNVQMVRQAAAVASTYIGLIGQLIVDLGSGAIRVHDGVTPGGSPTLMANNNLTDIPSPGNARNALGLGTAAVHAFGDFDAAGTAATAAAAAQAAAISTSEAYTDTSAAAIMALINLAQSDGTHGYFHIPNPAVPAKPWIVQWQTWVSVGYNPTNQPTGAFGSSVVINWPIAFPNSFRFGGANVDSLVANGNYAQADLVGGSVNGGTVLYSSGQNVAAINGTAWAVGN